MNRIIVVVNHRFEKSDVVVCSLRPVQPCHHAHHHRRIGQRHTSHRHLHVGGFGGGHHSHRVHTAHWHGVIVHVVPGEQPFVHKLNFGALRAENVLTEGAQVTV